jgi:hypothetical protein
LSYFLSTVSLLVWQKTGEEDQDGLPVVQKAGESELVVSSLAKLERIAAALGSPDGWKFLPD